jgi:hypothetical protein
MTERDYIEHHVMWERLGWFIIIKLFLPEGIERVRKSLIAKKRPGNLTYINDVVAECVVERDKLYKLVDKLGIAHRVAPPKIIKELYALCCKYNSGLLM